ncbi:hypothetical protein Syun_016821 [Stephania yunnanensis]|uniref:FCP1 homology domain-containing protein n=1 Tax=Stephania yunnanensis TaxID=152371 RepID=A0AAP0J5T4_9MAGN
MAELSQSTEVYAAAAAAPETLTIWRALINWLLFFFQVFVQIVRVRPSMSKVLSTVGFRHPMLSSSSTTTTATPISSSAFAYTATAYKPLPAVELPVVCAEDRGEDDSRRGDRLTVVLDLDETLVCAYETSSLPSALKHQAIEAGLKWFELECLSSDKEIDGQPKVNHVTVFERPRLKEFLKQSSEFADLVLFTAGLEGYARPLVDRIDVENCFSLRLYRPSTSSTQYREHVKDLSCISKDLSRIVIVDNNPFSFLLQPLNGIPCVPFSAGHPYNDQQLMEVLLPLLKHLSTQNDVRPVLYERFHMPEWFEKHGIPASSWAWN